MTDLNVDHVSVDADDLKRISQIRCPSFIQVYPHHTANIRLSSRILEWLTVQSVGLYELTFFTARQGDIDQCHHR